MCGIWGVFPRKNLRYGNKDLSLLKQMMIITSLRGMDSTGLAVVPTFKADAGVFKVAGGPENIFMDAVYKKLEDFIEKSGQVVFGHGRFATKGLDGEVGAHPFQHGHITLVHNGTIHHGLIDELNRVKSKVDSDALALAVSERGLVPTLDKIFGAYAVIVHDSKADKVHVVNNGQRPLHCIDLPDYRIIMSEEEALKFLLERNGATSGKNKDGEWDIRYFPAYQVFSYDLKSCTWDIDKSLEESQAKKYTYHPPKKESTGKGSEGGGTSQTIRFDLLLVGMEATKGGKTFRYEFVGDDGLTYYAISSDNREDRLGKIALCDDYQIVRDKKAKTEILFVKWRELIWPEELDEELKNATTKEEVEEGDTEVRFFNGRVKMRSKALALIKKHDCEICQGAVYEHEINQTILTADDGLICPLCIREGKHFAYGFGQ